jgi:hypothetical protein
MAFKLVESAQNHWRKPNGSTLLHAEIAGAIFKDGENLPVDVQRPTTTFDNSSVPAATPERPVPR